MRIIRFLTGSTTSPAGPFTRSAGTKGVILALGTLLLASCAREIEYRVPDSVTAVRIWRGRDSLLIEHTQYGGFYVLPTSGLATSATPTSQNTAPYESFSKADPQHGDFRKVEVKWNWVKAQKEGGRLSLRNYEGKLVTDGPAVYLLDVDSYGGRVLGYALVSPGEAPLVFFIKPEIKKRPAPTKFMSVGG